MNKSAKRTLKYLSLAVFGMFFFSFALVPLYDVFCEVTGLNGKISQSEEGVSYESNTGRDLSSPAPLFPLRLVRLALSKEVL